MSGYPRIFPGLYQPDIDALMEENRLIKDSLRDVCSLCNRMWLEMLPDQKHKFLMDGHQLRTAEKLLHK
jgi:hypothetical protein